MAGNVAATGAKTDEPARILHCFSVPEDVQETWSVGKNGLSQHQSVSFKPHRLKLEEAWLLIAYVRLGECAGVASWIRSRVDFRMKFCAALDRASTSLDAGHEIDQRRKG